MALAGATVAEITQLLAFLAWDNRTYSDFPKNFTLPPSYTDPNYVAPRRHQHVLEISAVSLAVAIVVVLARLAARLFRRKNNFGWDDWLIIPGTIFTAGFTAVQIAVAKGDCLGYHVYDCKLDGIVSVYRYRYAGLILYCSAACFIKLSTCALCLRFATSSLTALRRILQCTFVFILCTYIATVLMALFTCSPVSGGWNINVRIFGTHTRCLTEWKDVMAWAVVFALTDVWLVVIPIWLVIRLQLRIRARIGIIVIFSMGLVASVLALVKLSTVKSAYDHWDATWGFAPILIYSQLECCLGLIAASLPALSFLLVEFVPKQWRNGSAENAKNANQQAGESDPSRREKGMSGTDVDAKDPRLSTLVMQRLRTRSAILNAYRDPDPLAVVREQPPRYSRDDARHIRASTKQIEYLRARSEYLLANPRSQSRTRRLWSEGRKRLGEHSRERRRRRAQRREQSSLERDVEQGHDDVQSPNTITRTVYIGQDFYQRPGVGPYTPSASSEFSFAASNSPGREARDFQVGRGSEATPQRSQPRRYPDGLDIPQPSGRIRSVHSADSRSTMFVIQRPGDTASSGEYYPANEEPDNGFFA